MDPNFPVAYLLLGGPYVGKGMFKEAVATHEKCIAPAGGSNMALTFIAYAKARSDQRAEALKIAEQFRETSKQKYVPPYQFALIYAALGENDQAFEWLEKAYEERSDYLAYVKSEFLWDPIRSDPRVAELLRRMNPED